MEAFGCQFGVATRADYDLYMHDFGIVAEEAAMPFWKLTFHLLKWATQTGRVPMMVRYQDQRRWRDAACQMMALVYARDPRAIFVEARAYIAKCAQS